MKNSSPSTVRFLGLGLASLGLAAGATLVNVASAEASPVLEGSTSWGSYHCSKAYLTDGDAQLNYRCTIKDRSKDGHGVYLQSKGVRDHMWDTSWHRLTPNTSGAGESKVRHGAISANSVDSWRVRVCKEVSDTDDPCSAWDSVS